MTVDFGARYTTKYLLASFDKWLLARRANLFLSGSAQLPAMSDGTAAAPLGVTLCFPAAISAMLGVFGRAGQLSTVNNLMARNTYRHPVINFQREFRVFCEFLFVMRVKALSLFAANLAGVIISFVNRLAPLVKTPAQFPACSLGRFTASPYGRRFPGFPIQVALIRTEYFSPINGIEHASTRSTFFEVWFTAIPPAFFRAKFARIRSMLFNLVSPPTNDAFENNPGVSTIGNGASGALNTAILLNGKPGSKSLTTLLACASFESSDIEVMPPDKPDVVGFNRATAPTLAKVIHSSYYTIISSVGRQLAVTMQRYTAVILQRMVDAFPGITAELIDTI